MKKTLLVVDGSSLIYRAYHSPALSRLQTRDGVPSGIVFGFHRSLNVTISHYQPQALCVVFDPRGKTVRHDWLASYKANRPPTPQEIVDGFEFVKQLLQYRNIPFLSIARQEADDVIGTLAYLAKEQHWQCNIVSSDKDLCQLINESTRMVNVHNGKIREMDRHAVIEKYGVGPDQMIDWLALTGDAVDNIPGVPGIGPKKAAQLLTKFANIEGIKANLHQIPGKLGESLRNELDQLSLYQKLTTINTQLHLEYDELNQPITHYQLTPPSAQQIDQLKAFYYRFDFRRELDNLNANLSAALNAAQVNATNHATTEEQPATPQPNEGHAPANDQHQAALNAYPQIAFKDGYEALLQALNDLSESDQQHPSNGQSVDGDGVADWGADERVQYLQISELIAIYRPSQQRIIWHCLEPQQARSVIERLAKATVPVYAIDWKSMLRWLCEWSTTTNSDTRAAEWIQLDQPIPCWQDLMLMSYLINSNRSSHIWPAILHHLDTATIHAEMPEKALKQTMNTPFSDWSEHDLLTLITPRLLNQYQLTKQLLCQLNEQPALKTLYEDLENPLKQVLLHMEINGIHADVNELKRINTLFDQQSSELQQHIYQLSGEPFNIDSPKQVGEILYQKLTLPVLKKTPSGSPSTNEETLQQLADAGHPIAAKIIAYRGLTKLQSTYSFGLQKHIRDSGRIHAHLNQAVTNTGRLSCSDPNLQNIPIRSEEGRLIRKAFCVPENSEPAQVLMAADYSQIELRILAHQTDDDGLVEAFNSHQDIHASTAAKVFNVDLASRGFKATTLCEDY